MVSQKTYFKTLQQFKAEYCPCEFALYESQRTGMRVVVVDQPGPKVYGYFALATEIHDDSGAPHTLEHLVFMGSKSYKYKGILDKMATRAYSNTNAWTATDHTAYTLDTAGWEGFAQILPVYLEHVLLPTLTDAGCYTEVHHIDGTGHDAGVVYSEMQGTQNNQGELMDLKARRTIYPESVGFRYETGGMLEQLRVLTADRIRAFHREMYQPKNLCLVLIGEVDHKNLLSILDKFEDGILDDVPSLSAPFTRPWEKAGRTPKILSTTIETVEFPEEDESMGEVLIGFLGPDFNDDLMTAALSVFLVYICGSSVSLLENTLVETEQLASSVYYSTDSRPDTMIWFTVSGVETRKLEKVEARFFEVLKEAASTPFDLDYLRDCVERSKTQIRFYAEESGNFFADGTIEDHLYGSRDGTTLRQLGTLEEYNTLASWSDHQWKEFFNQWFIEPHHVSVLGVPSKKLSKKLKQEEKDRVKAQQEKLGKAGLAKLGAKLKAAQTENDREIPNEILKKFKVPGTESIHFIPTTTATSGFAQDVLHPDNEIQRTVDGDKSQYPLFIHFEHIPTNFVHVNLILCTHMVPVELRPLLSVYIMNFFDTPVHRDGQRVDFEKIVVQLEKDTVGYNMDTAGALGNSELLRIRMQVKPTEYVAAIEWLRYLLFNSIFDESRLQATLAKMLADIPEEKRSGDSMLSAATNMLHLSKESTIRAENTLVKSLYLRRTLAMLKKEPQSVIANFEKIRAFLAVASNFRVLVLANLQSGELKAPVSSWDRLTSSLDLSNPSMQPLDSRAACLSDAGKKPGGIAYIIPMPTSDSSYACLTTRGVDSYEHPQLPALSVALAYLGAVEGPLWVAVRGTGLAYGTNFSRDIANGLLKYSIYRSPDAYNAFTASEKIVRGIADGTVALDDLAMEGAISSIVVSFADEQPTMSHAANVGFVNQVIKGIPKDWGVGFLKKVRGVSKEEIKKVLQEIVLPVFSPSRTNLLVTCATIMEEKMMKGFQDAGFNPESRTLASFEDDYGLEGDDLSDGEEDEEMDDAEEDGDEDEDESMDDDEDEDSEGEEEDEDSE